MLFGGLRCPADIFMGGAPYRKLILSSGPIEKKIEYNEPLLRKCNKGSFLLSSVS